MLHDFVVKKAKMKDEVEKRCSLTVRGQFAAKQRDKLDSKNRITPVCVLNRKKSRLSPKDDDGLR